MPDQPPSWRQYDAPGDEPGDVPLPEPAPDQPTVGDTPFVPYGRPQDGSASSAPPATPPAPATTGRRAGRGVVLGAVAAVAVGGAALFFVAGGGDGIGIDGPGSPDMHSQEALDDLIAEVRDEHGTSEVYDANFYPDRAYVDVHVPGGNGHRYDSYSWDGGDLEEWSSSGSDEGATIDLAELDGTEFDGFCDQVKKLVEEPGDCYIIVDPDDAAGDGGLYSAYASNDYSEGAYIRFDRAGAEVFRSTW
jgi:hypothetical protein